MVLVIGALVVGFLLSHFGIIHSKWKTAVTKISEISLMILLFSMGLSLGSNPELLSALPSLGFQSFMLAIGIVAGSVVFTWLGVKAFGRFKP